MNAKYIALTYFEIQAPLNLKIVDLDWSLELDQSMISCQVQVCIARLIFDIQLENQDTNVLLAFSSRHFHYCIIFIRIQLQNSDKMVKRFANRSRVGRHYRLLPIL